MQLEFSSPPQAVSHSKLQILDLRVAQASAVVPFQVAPPPPPPPLHVACSSPRQDAQGIASATQAAVLLQEMPGNILPVPRTPLTNLSSGCVKASAAFRGTAS